MTKAWLRKKYLTRRKSMDDMTYRVLSQKIQALFLNYFNLEKFRNIHTYLSLYKNKEVDTHYIILHTLQNRRDNTSVSVPKLSSQGIQSYQLDVHTQMKENQWGIQEPVNSRLVHEHALELIILPLIIFDKRGYRVGYGKGHYDRYLKTCNQSARKVGLCFEAPVEAIEDIDAYDMPMDYCVTPNEVFRFDQ